MSKVDWSKEEKRLNMMKGVVTGFRGNIWNQREKIELEAAPIDWRWSTSQRFNRKKMKVVGRCVEFLLKPEGFKRARWTRPIFWEHEGEMEEEEVAV